MELHESVKDVNVKLIEKIKAAILEEPRRIRMNFWIMTDRDLDRLDEGQVPPCNTVGCIAGWARVLNGPISPAALEDLKTYTHATPNVAQGLLNLTHDQSQSLFYPDEWPAPYARYLEDMEAGTPEYAQMVVDRIDHFLTTGK